MDTEPSQPLRTTSAPSPTETVLRWPRDVVSTPELRAEGVDQRHTARLVRAGALTPLHRGWYATRAPDGPEDRHQLSALALARMYAGSAVPSHYTELLRLGLPTFRADLSTVHLMRIDDGKTTSSRPGVTVHRQLGGALGADTRPAGRSQTRGPAGPAAQVPAGPPDLGAAQVPAGPLGPGAARVPADPLDLWAARVPAAVAIVQTGVMCGPMDALIAADAALHRGLITRADLDAAVRLVRHHPGSQLVGPFLTLADPRAESPGETRLRHALHLMRLPVLSQAQIVHDGRIAVADFLLREHPVIVEFDGLVKYQGPGGSADRVALVREKEREDWLRGLGFEIERVVWHELDRPRALARRMGLAISRTRGRPVPTAWVEAVRLAAGRPAA